MNIAIIPARGGSKRILDKNIIDFFGKPIIAYTIDAAKKTGLFEKIIVSTDSEKIAEEALKYGADVPFLREASADDYSPVSEATLFTLLQAENYYSTKFDNVIQLMANCPNRTDKNIRDAFNYFYSNNLSSIISCFKFGWMNPWWAVILNENNQPTKLFDNTNIRSQDLPELYCPTGAIWIAKSQILKQHKTFYGPDYRFFEINWQNAVDIDNYDDLEFAEIVFNKIVNN